MKLTEHYPFLSKIDSPADLRHLSIKELKQVCIEIRSYILEVLSENPGHLGSSLGTVELTVALHYVLNTPRDKIIWDIGHQSYGHKILTGRRDLFKNIRKLGGISGFTNPNESEYDSFISGHASNSISVALGMAIAFQLKGEYNKVVAVIGDGAMTGGLSFEGLNNVSESQNDLLIILNDNQMSIDRPVGGLSSSLVKITTSQMYNNIRFKLYLFLKKCGIINEKRKGIILRFNNSIKAFLTKQHNVFEGFNIRYFGPIDGHNLIELIKVFQDVKEMKGPKLLHIRTQKGKGFKPAEKDPNLWHAPGKFNPKIGEKIRSTSTYTSIPPLYQDVFGLTLLELAKQNDKIVGVTPAMITGCSMTFLMQEIPHRVFDVGIAEGHAVTFSAGLAKVGLIPFCNIYSSFLQRAYDNIIHDSALQNLPIILCIDRSGLVGEDGATHHGVFDLAYLHCIPNIIIAAPIDEIDLRNLMYTAIHYRFGVFAIRYPKGRGEFIHWETSFKQLPIGKGKRISDGQDVAIVSIGSIGNTVKKAILYAKKFNIMAAHYDIIYLKPIDEELLHEVGKNYRRIIVVEDGTLIGGLGTIIIKFMYDNGYRSNIKLLGVPDKFIPHGQIEELHKICGIDMESIVQCLLTSH